MAYLDSNGLETQISYIKGYVQNELSNFTPTTGSFLPLAGGTMTGDISWNNGDVVAKFNSSNKLVFPDGTTVWIS